MENSLLLGIISHLSFFPLKRVNSIAFSNENALVNKVSTDYNDELYLHEL